MKRLYITTTQGIVNPKILDPKNLLFKWHSHEGLM